MAITAENAFYTAALKHASQHRVELAASGHCGCYSCFRMFAAKDIRNWIDKEQTALCPRCGLDSVIGAASGHTVDERFLRKMHQHHVGYRSR